MQIPQVAIFFGDAVLIVVLQQGQRVLSGRVQQVTELTQNQSFVLRKMLLCYLTGVLVHILIPADLRRQHHQLTAGDQALHRDPGRYR